MVNYYCVECIHNKVCKMKLVVDEYETALNATLVTSEVSLYSPLSINCEYRDTINREYKNTIIHSTKQDYDMPSSFS